MSGAQPIDEYYEDEDDEEGEENDEEGEEGAQGAFVRDDENDEEEDNEDEDDEEGDYEDGPAALNQQNGGGVEDEDEDDDDDNEEDEEEEVQYVGSVPNADAYQAVGRDEYEEGYEEEFSDDSEEDEDGGDYGDQIPAPPAIDHDAAERFCCSLLREDRLSGWNPAETGKLVALLANALGYEDRPNKTLEMLQDAAMPVSTEFFIGLNREKQLLPGLHMLDLVQLNLEGQEWAETVTELVQREAVNLSEPRVSDQIVLSAVESEELTPEMRSDFLKELMEEVPRVQDRKALVQAINRQLPEPERTAFFEQVPRAQSDLHEGASDQPITVDNSDDDDDVEDGEGGGGQAVNGKRAADSPADHEGGDGPSALKKRRGEVASGLGAIDVDENTASENVEVPSMGEEYYYEEEGEAAA